MITLTNPLTSEERLSLMRLDDHTIEGPFSCGLISLQAAILRKGPPKERTYNKLYFAFRLNRLVKDFINMDYFSSFKNITKEDIEKNIKLLRSTVNANELSLEYKGFSSILSKDELIRGLLTNTFHNSCRYSDNISIIIEPSAFPEGASFIPEGARDYDKFIAFRVCDRGKGFPLKEQKDYQSYFTTCPPKGKNGCGLYFTGLVAKVLRAPLEIQSIPGDTRVSFYHPIYSESE